MQFDDLPLAYLGDHAIAGDAVLERIDFMPPIRQKTNAAFGVVMILFLVFEPLGLVGIFRRIQSYLLLWPFKQKPLGGAGP